MIIIMFTGVPLGGGLPGLVAKTLVPLYGWPILFWIGGLAPILMALVVWWAVPESIKFLVVRERARAAIEALLRRLQPGIALGPQTRITVQDEKQYTGLSPRHLFGDGMALITPLLWFCFATNLMAYFFLASWMPTLLTDAKLISPADAGLASMLLQFGGVAGSWLLCRPMDRKGLLPITLMFGVAVPAIGCIGLAAGSQQALFALIALAGFCTLGLQSGLNAISGMIYPTAYRSSGSGWALAVGRIGSFVGPFFGSFLLKSGLSMQLLFVYAAIPSALGTLACFVLMGRYAVRFGGRAIGERDRIEQAAREAGQGAGPAG
jgi:AAHS family 4-hydroxybenzoate transporter-like MFS transporter